MRATILVLGVVVAMLAAGRGAEHVSAVGEGIFQLDKTAYSTPEGTAALVTIQRTDGGTLTQDVKVILAVDGETEFDIPSAEATKLVTFPKGSNLASLPVFIQTLNKEQFEDRTIQVTILSVDNGGLIGARSTAPITLLGSGTPRVFDVSPDSGGDYPTDGTVLTVTGENFGVSGATITSTVLDVQFFPILGGPGSLPVTVASGDVFDITPTQLKVKIPTALLTDYVAVYPNQSAASYYVRVDVDTNPPQTPQTALSPKTPGSIFVFTSGPTVTGLSVRQGPPTGSTQVLVTGTNFIGTPGNPCPSLSTVTFGGIPVTSCQYITADSILVTTPAHLSGPVYAVVFNGGALSPPVPDALFTYRGLPVITGLNPSFGPASGGNTVEIYGSNFLTNNTLPTAVLFGGNEATFLVVNDNKIIATAPPGSGVQQVRVVHPVSGTSDFVTEANYIYSSGPLVTSIDPAHGPSSGGAIITINGTGFLAGASVKFGAQQAFSTVVGPTQILATAPPGAGIVDITVTVNGNVSAVGPQTQFSYDGPAVTEVSPIAGPVAGGTAIVIRGNNFTTASVITIGGIVAPAVFVDPTTLTTTTPPSPGPQAAHVVVTTGSGSSPQTAADVFTYTNGPIVDAVNPNSGPTTGASIVVITGKNFLAPLSVSFGGIPATSFNVNSATQITVLSPSNGTAGPADVRVTKGTDVSPVGPNTKFTYVSAVPAITLITPNSGSTFGGTEITITGQGFTGAACPGSVKFGAVQAATCTVVNDTTITTKAPPNVAGPTVVVVQTINGTSEITPNYTYVSPNGPGGGTAPPAPSPGGTTTYTLAARWTLLTWTGLDGASVSDAVRGTGVVGGADLSGRISALYLWKSETSSYEAYFTGAEAVPGANDFSTLTQGAVYWVAILGTGQVPWVVNSP